MKTEHLIAGEWVPGEGSFKAVAPAMGVEIEPSFAEGSEAIVDRAAQAAEAAYPEFAAKTRAERAAFLRACADEIDARGPQLTERGMQETALPEARLNGERGRTIGQLRMFADWIEEGSYLGARLDSAMPDRAPLPRADLRLTHLPLGPVAVFGASNFPLAFSVAGGDTASALAAGCPVVFKGHPAHPGVGALVGEAIAAAAAKTGMPAGVFSLVHGAGHAVGGALVQHPLIKAVGFTGSLRGGRALFNLCAARPEPIPFYGELGSVNPMFLLPNALQARGEAIAKGWIGSLTLGVGQFCTNPGVVVGMAGDALSGFVETAAAEVANAASAAMLTPGIAGAYRSALEARSDDDRRAVGAQAEGVCNVAPAIYEVSAARWNADESLRHEVFGPSGVVVGCASEDEMVAVARGLEGQLTATLQLDEADHPLAAKLTPLIARAAGRVIANGFPTGVEVCHAMMHGGPYPASTDARSTSVGSLAITRWMRPIAFQDMPQALLPTALQDDASNLLRLVDGKWSVA
ncbi:MAG: aldehyde dehydrogenase (NADP(+)) [Neomegalonema sp.]|nr:aldehyde dehydrogenase (NADP(+)) [Neomegalonema sp.]